MFFLLGSFHYCKTRRRHRISNSHPSNGGNVTSWRTNAQHRIHQPHRGLPRIRRHPAVIPIQFKHSFFLTSASQASSAGEHHVTSGPRTGPHGPCEDDMDDPQPLCGPRCGGSGRRHLGVLLRPGLPLAVGSASWVV